MEVTKQYDYIIAGAGCAGLSLVMHMLHSGELNNKEILIVDKAEKNRNDRTWCFWEKGNGLFQTIVYKQWQQLFFHSKDLSKELEIDPYNYKLIRGIDFYEYCFTQINKHSNIHFLNADIEDIFSNSETGIVAGGQKFTCHFIFNSTFQKPQLQKKQYWLLQHFKGWFIKTKAPAFNPAIATLMDFRTSQDNGSTFFYALPFSETEALIEYTLFSHQLLNDHEYDEALKNYIEQQLKIKSYSVSEKEFGVIPMTNYVFPTGENNIINIGTAGGQTKGSSGYTFQFIQKHSTAIVKCLINQQHPSKAEKAGRRFHFYDSVLLNILHRKSLPGDFIFSRLFEKNRADKVLKFLDNETSLAEEIGIISSLPKLPFTKAAIQQIF